MPTLSTRPRTTNDPPAPCRVHRLAPPARARAPQRGAVTLGLALLVGGLAGPLATLEALEPGVVPHTELRLSIPAADSVVDGDIHEVILEFTTTVQGALSRIEVVGPGGNPVAASDVAHPSDDRRDRLLIRFDSPLPPGAYRVNWRTVSPDSHMVEGDFAFQIQGDVAPAPDTLPATPPPAADTPAVPPLQEEERVGLLSPGTLPPGTLQRWLHLLATVLLVGIVAFRFGVLRPLSGNGDLPALAERSTGPLRTLGWVSIVLLAITLVTRIDRQLLELGGGERAWDFLSGLLLRTGWGAGWFLHLAVIVLAATGLVLSRRPGSERRGWGILTGAGVILPVIPALQGHAMGSALREAAIPIMYLHVGAASVWLGGLLMLILVGLPAVRKAGSGSGKLPPIARMVNAFSRFALLAVVVLVVSGSATSFLHTGGDVGAIFGSDWGRALILKLIVVGAAFLMGFYNWRRVRPSLADRPDPGALRIPSSVEAFLGLVVLLATAVLVALPLP
jgi:copper transport protein